jgi:hypothetical protein
MFQRLKEALALFGKALFAILKVAKSRLNGGGVSEFCAPGRASGGADGADSAFRGIARHSQPAPDYTGGRLWGAQ